MVTVKVAKRLYQMTEDRSNKLLKVAADLVPFGVYAVRKGNYIELHNQKFESRSALKRARRGLKEQGFQVYCNGL